MAGKGAMPKPPDQLVGNGASKSRSAQFTVVTADPVPQPPLPEVMPNGEPWPERTLEWWSMWGEDALAQEFRPTDWSELMDCAAVHGEFWSGNTKLAGELRLRTQTFGSTAESRARLRIQFAAAEEADDKRKRSVSGDRSGARGRRAPLKAV